MVILIVILAIILLLALLRIGMTVEYSADGVSVMVRVGFVPVRVFPRKEKPEKAEKPKKEKKAKKKKEIPEEKKPGKLQYFLNIVSAAKKPLGRLRRKLLIKYLTIRLTTGGEDPSKTAMMFGAANAAFGTVMPMLDMVFRIRRRDLRAEADFDAVETLIYVKAAISLAVWEAVYIFFAILPLLSVIANKPADKMVKKGEVNNGEASDK